MTITAEPRTVTKNDMNGLLEREREALEEDENDDVAGLRSLAAQDDEDDEGSFGADVGAGKPDKTEARADEDSDDDAPAAKPVKRAKAVPAAASDNADDASEDDGVQAREFDAPFAVRLPVEAIEGYEDKRAELLDERKNLRAQHRTGELTVDELDEKVDAVNENLTKLDLAHQKAKANAEFNAQLEGQQYWWNVKQFFTQVKAESGGRVDYANNSLMREVLDRHVVALQSSEDTRAQYEKNGLAWALEVGHQRAVKELRDAAKAIGATFEPTPGVGAKPGAPSDLAKQAVRDAIKGRGKDKPMGSLATVPAAPGGDDDGAEFAHLEKLDGMAFERALAKMSPEQQERYLASN
jgi:hypothetical protein